MKNDNPPDEQQLREKHVKEQHSGKFKDCPKCAKILNPLENASILSASERRRVGGVEGAKRYGNEKH